MKARGTETPRYPDPIRPPKSKRGEGKEVRLFNAAEFGTWDSAPSEDEWREFFAAWEQRIYERTPGREVAKQKIRDGIKKFEAEVAQLIAEKNKVKKQQDVHANIGDVDEPALPRDDLGIMDEAATACKLAADYYGLPVEKVQRTLEALRATERETTTRAAAEPRSDAQPAAIEWPTAKWKDAPEKILGKKRGIITFLKREWEPFIKASGIVVTQDTFAAHDEDAERAFSRHLAMHDFPKGISIIYPRHVAKVIERRPDLVRVVLG